MTPEYTVQWPSSSGIWPDMPGDVIKWTHTVVHEKDFVSEWEAGQRATELALQCQTSTHSSLPNLSGKHKKLVGSASVSFAPCIDVCFGCEDSWRMFQVTVPEKVLTCDVKPWSIENRFVGDSVHLERFDYCKDILVPVPELFAGFIPHDCLSPPLEVKASCCDPPSPGEAVLIPGLLSTAVPSDNCVQDLSKVPHSFVAPRSLSDVLSSGADAFCLPDDHFHDQNTSWLNRNDVEPVGCALTPVSCPNDQPATTGPHAPDSTTSADTAGNEQHRAGSPIRLPLFAQQMIVNLPSEFVTNPVRIVRGVLVRTWYLHHVNIPKSLQARPIMLSGPPHLWRAQILTTWNDFLIPCEDITLDLVNPAPPRNWHETNILFDLILAQGLYAGRMSGLVSVSPTITEPSLRMYAIAVSFAPFISGQDVITESDVQPLCNRFDCLIFHAMNQLYMDFQPVHHMTHGDGFVVYLSRRPTDPPTASVGVLAEDDPVPEPQQSQVSAMDMEAEVPSAQHGAATSSGAAGSQLGNADQDLRRITIYRLDRVSVSAWVRWRRFSLLLQDVLAATALSPSDLVAIHAMLVKPIGDHPTEISVIVQHLWDIAPGSDESLMLLDTVFHQQGPVTNMFVPPVVDRKVVKLPCSITRQGLLHVARVANYCESGGKACVVSINHDIWNAQSLAPKFILHGSYGRIQVPPVNVPGVETCRAVSLIEDVIDPVLPNFAQVYPQAPHHADVNVRPPQCNLPSSQCALSDGLRSSMPQQCHLGTQHTVDGPAFETSTPVQAAPVFPNAPDWDDFARELQSQFEDFSVTEIPEEGPILHVVTWFVHHDRTPMCLVGRLVRLSHRPHEWFQLLLAPWIHLLQPFDALAFRLVKPAPPSHIPGMSSVHVILEQGLQQARMTALFSAVFQGLHGDLTHRRAQSIPTVLSHDAIVRILDIQDLCRARICTAWSGRAQFRRQRLDPVFNGIGISLTVDAFRNRFANVDDDGFPLHDASSSSQVPPRMSFRQDDATLFPFPSTDADVDDDSVVEHAPSRLIPELRLVWERYLMTTERGPYRFYVETWFCDHDRFPRTDRSREVLLPPDQNSWKDAILEKWRDMIDPNVEVVLYVVSPKPFGGPTDILAHVILAQHQHRGFISALITTVAPGDDVWDPPRIALKLPAVVDKGLLLQESGLVLYCPPFIPFNDCRATIGNQQIPYATLTPAHSGDGFLCTVEASEAPSVQHSQGPLLEFDVQRLFETLGRTIATLTSAVLHADKMRLCCQDSLEALDFEMQEVQNDIQCFLQQRDVQSLNHDQPCATTPSMLWNPLRTVEEPPFVATVGVQWLPRAPLSIACIKSLIHLWQQLPQPEDGHNPLVVQVWFIDHIRSPCCRKGKVVSLVPPFDHWPQALLQPWLMHVWPQVDICVDLVKPFRYCQPSVVHAHVTLTQHPIADMKSVMCATLPPRSGVPAFDLRVCSLPSMAHDDSLHACLRHEFAGEFDTAQWTFEIFLDGVPWPSGSHVSLSHADCLVVLPTHPEGSWIGLPDPEFQHCIRTFLGQLDKPATSAPSPSVPCPGFPVSLSLDAVVPRTRPLPNQPLIEHYSTLEWSRFSDWRTRVIDSLDIKLQPIPVAARLTEATQMALFEAFEGSIGPYELIEVFVDGATSSTGAAWTVVVVVHFSGSVRLLGLLAGPVVLGNMDSHWLGATTVDNIAAELHALAAALAFVIQAQFSCPVAVRPDLSLSRLVAQELVTTVSNPTLAKICRLLASWAPPNLSFHEVRGHSGNPWNDLADSVAKHVLENPDAFPPVLFGELHVLANESHDLEWNWTADLPRSMKHCFPNVVHDTVWQFSPSMRKIHVQPLDMPPEPECLTFQCKVATINVLALDRTEGTNEVGRRAGARTLRLDHQLHGAQFQMIGLQETRTVPGQFRSDHFTIFASGGEGPSAARFGCELWLHNTIPLLHTPAGLGITLADCKCVALHADPRRLFVRIEHEVCQLTAIVLHAPCLGKSAGDANAPIDVVKQWWSETSRIWHEVVTTGMICAFVDANATLATSATEFFQEHHADVTTAQSHIFEEFLVDHALYAPSTFAAHHVGPSFTWTHSSGRRMRLDFVLLSHSLFQMVTRSETMLSYDGTFSHEDHIPACLELNGWIQGHTPIDRPIWDDLALMDPDRCRAFQSALATLPVPAWEIAVDRHSALYEKQFVQLARQFFTKTSRTKRRPTLSAEALAAIAFKRHILDCGRAWHLMTDPTFKEELKAIEIHVRRLVTRDLQIFYDQILVQLQEAGHLSNHKQMFKMITRLGGKRHKRATPARPLPMLRDPTGQKVRTYAQQQQLWMNQFSRIEAGLPMHWHALQKADSTGLGLTMDLPEAAAFPTDWQLQEAVSHLKRGKMPGPNGITPCLLKAGGSVFTKQFVALTTKTVAHGKEPTSWKGGRLAPLHKGRGATSDPAAYRAIYISDYTSKLYHRMLRQQLEVAWIQHTDLLQLGGKKGCGTDIAHHMLEAHQFWYKKRKLTSAVVFFDLRAAFYSVLRQALVAHDMDPTSLITALGRMGVPSQVVDNWLHQAAQDHALIDASLHVEKLIQDCMVNTFFTIDGVPGVCKTTRGTRPGDPLGDLLFNLIMRLVLQDTHQYVQSHTDASWLGSPKQCQSFADSNEIPDCAYFDVSFVDDAAIAIHAQSLPEMEQLIKTVVEGFHQASAARGLDVNFEQGKTEVLWDVRGKGSKSLKERLHDENQMLRWNFQGHSFALRLSHSYKHLGSWMQVAGSHQREVAHRASLAMQSWGCLAKSFYQKRHVGLKAKATAFQSLSLSRMLFHAHTWTGVAEDTLAHWQQKLRKPIGLMAKPLLRGVAPVLVDTCDLFAVAGILQPIDQLHVARLRYLKRLLRFCPQGLWDLLF